MRKAAAVGTRRPERRDPPVQTTGERPSAPSGILLHVAVGVAGLRASLERDLKARQYPEFGGEPLWANLSGGSRRHLSKLVEWTARHRPEVHGAFADADELTTAFADAAETLASTEWDLDALMTEASSNANAAWVVTVPLLGTAARELLLLDPQTAIAPSGTWRGRHDDHRSAQAIGSDIKRAIGAPATVSARYVHGANDQLLDTRCLTALIHRWTGSRGSCRRRSFELARLLLAVLLLQSPPEEEMFAPFWPSVSEWQPAPTLQVQHADWRVDEYPPKKRNGATVLHGPGDDVLWQWPSDDVVARAWRAIQAVERSRAAAAILTASWELYLAARTPTGEPWIARLLHIMLGREVLCEDPSGDGRAINRRFTAVTRRLKTLDNLIELGWRRSDLEDLNGSLRTLRNIAVHSADVTRLRLGYPPLRTRDDLPERKATAIAVREATSPAFHAVRSLTLRLLEEMDGVDYDDERFESLFV